MAKTLGTTHTVPGSYRSDEGSLTELAQVAKTDNDSDNGVIQSGSNDAKAMFNDVTNQIAALENRPRGSLSADDQALLARLRRIASQLEDIVSKIEADAEITDVTITPGTANFVDWGAAGQRYKSANITITGSGATRSIAGADPANGGFWAVSGQTESVSANTVLLWARDTAGTEFAFLRQNSAGQLQINNYLSAVTNTDTAAHHARFTARPANASRVMSGSSTTLSWDFPTLTGTLRDDSIFRLDFHVDVNVNGQTRDFPDFLNVRHHPAGANSAVNWDDVTAGNPLYPQADSDGWVARSGIIWEGQTIVLEWRITEISSAKVFQWRVQDGAALPAGVSVTFSSNDIEYYLSNGRSATNQWFTLETSAGNDWAGTTDDYDFMLQVHPSTASRPTSFSQVVPVVRDENGTETQLNDVILSNQNPVQYVSQFRTDTNMKSMTNNFATNLTHSSLEAHLRNYDLEYVWGYALNRSLGTEVQVDGNLDIIGDGKLKFNGSDAAATDVQALPDFTFNVMGASHTAIVNNCYVVQPEDHGQLIAINPGSTCIFVIIPRDLWTTEYNFKVSVTLDAAANGLIRVCAPHFIGRPGSINDNAPVFAKQGGTQVASTTTAFSTVSGLPGQLRYPDALAAAVNYSAYDWCELWHARDWASFNMVNSAGWCGIEGKWLERMLAPQNPTASQILGVATQSFSAALTNPTRTITTTKYRYDWEADNT